MRKAIHQTKINAKGKVSEGLSYLKMLRLSDEYIIINDLLFSDHGHSTQIDHIIISPYGIFVIETKGYKGWILGGEDSEYWIHSLYNSKYQFYNPVRQNDGHVRFLRRLLKDYGDIPIIPIVVFNNSATIKVNVFNHWVINRRNLLDTIRQYDTIAISDNDIDSIVKLIQDNTKTDSTSKKQHIKYTKEQHNQAEIRRRNNICPNCGGQLVKRNGKYGSFYGCSNYPKCKYTTR